MATTEVKEALRALERDGKLYPRDIVDAARDKSSPLHSFFEWKDEQAAERYRIQQARTLIRSITIDVVERDIPLITTHRYLRDPSDDEENTAGYVDITRLKTNADRSREALIEELKRLMAIAKRARGVAQYLGFLNDIERIDEIAQSVLRRTGNSAGTAPDNDNPNHPPA